jgi:hypothetical protein
MTYSWLCIPHFRKSRGTIVVQLFRSPFQSICNSSPAPDWKFHVDKFEQGKLRDQKDVGSVNLNSCQDNPCPTFLRMTDGLCDGPAK